VTQQQPYSSTTVCTKILILYFFFICNSIQAQEEFVQARSKLITKFSFTQLSGGVVTLRGTIDNLKDSLTFVLDTGSGGISLDSATAKQLGLTLTKSDRTIRGIAGMRKVDFALNHVLRLPGLQTDSMDFHINDYEILTNSHGVKIDGIIGFSFLRRYIVRLDFDKNIIELFTPGLFKYERGGHLIKPRFTPLPVDELYVNDNRAVHAKYIFDTGAGLNVLLSSDFESDSSIIKKKRKRYTTQVEGMGGKRLMELTVAEQVKLGPYKFRNVPVHIFEDEYNLTMYPQLAGLLGNDLLRRFTVVLNYPEQSIHIKPNSHYTEPFDYSYTGLGIYQDGGDVRVLDVIEDSPAKKAGFMVNDLIFAIGNTFTKNVQVFKNALQQTIGKIRVLVVRDGKPTELQLHVVSIKSNRIIRS
jgi:predicted aspartyl protease